MANSKNQTFFYRTAQTILPLLVAAICLYYILTNFQWLEIWHTLRAVNLSMFLAASILMTILFWFLRTLRWAFLLKNEQLAISFFKLYLYTAVVIGFANFTPFQSGEALKVEVLRKYSSQKFSGYQYFFLEKLLDLLTISLLATFSVFVLFESNLANQLQLAIVGLIVFLAILILLFVIASKRFCEKLRMYRRITQLQNGTLIAIFLLTLLSWTTMIFGWKFVFQSAAIDLTVRQTVAVVSLTTVIGILSLVPSAVGVSEVSIAAMLSQIGYAPITAQTGAVMIALYSLVILILSCIHLIILKVTNMARDKMSLNTKNISRNKLKVRNRSVTNFTERKTPLPAGKQKEN